ncbi:hypothetical protein [Novosphingobium sp. UBA1939]|uniref:hypothetical protein n=1 Tax=Novosphingobium sp. UBA1939 TaxID=1946982 RepID=UPI0025CEECAA|nr:hypothetical protein [Novosphingobium sp. UBA1939]
MGAIAPLLIAGVASAGATAALSSALAPKPKTYAAPVQRVDRTSGTISDELASRRGSRVNRRTGGLGAEADPSSGTKSKLGT